MNITCPECSYVHKGLGRDLIGKLVSCAECGTKFEIGPPIPQPPPVPRKKRLPLTQTHPGAVAFTGHDGRDLHPHAVRQL